MMEHMYIRHPISCHQHPAKWPKKMSQSGPSLPLANLASLVITTLLYGMYFIIFVISIYLMVMHANPGRGREKLAPLFKSTVFVSGILLFITITADWISVVIRNFQGFIYFNDGLSANTFFSDDSQALSRVDDVFIALSVFIGDAMIIYRLWVVWSFNKIVIVAPVLSLIGLVICGVLAARATQNVQDVPNDTELVLVVVFTLVTSIYCTVFISWKIWQITRTCMPVGGLNLRSLMAMIVESAALYTCWLIYLSVTHQLNSTLQYIASSVTIVIGIANALIHARIGMGRTIEQVFGSTSSRDTAPMHFAPRPASGGTIGTDSHSLSV
ncbi:hypothetical protein DFH08DRAFT_833430 [Mycena albidolilacea]|uniref:Uncharacterized protein n=1 Tax=Mycena albidolilacea TaxID=1033008 RepID=A0AAD7F4L3_9AGAR|nr:hypothetical protein DFH08DRAFT_833430 [Mycena albidolilacea]